MKILGSLASSADLPASGTAGDAYLISGNLWVWAGSAWTNAGNIQGPQGPQGLQGPQGIQGPQGPQGTPGNLTPEYIALGGQIEADAQTAATAAATATAEANRAATYIPTSSAKAISGLVPFNDATAPTTTIGISPGSARDKDNNVDIILAAALTKRLNAAWTAGSGNGGLDTGAVAADTGYHIFIIRNPTTSVVDILFSTSATNPVMPAGFTQRRRIGALMTAPGSTSILAGY